MTMRRRCTYETHYIGFPLSVRTRHNRVRSDLRYRAFAFRLSDTGWIDRSCYNLCHRQITKKIKKKNEKFDPHPTWKRSQSHLVCGSGPAPGGASTFRSQCQSSHNPTCISLKVDVTQIFRDEFCFKLLFCRTEPKET